MKISTVIPAYNAERTIGRAIESVLKQTRPADEIIVIDDGSADRTGDAVRAFGDKITLIRQENAGASVARNIGINAATGDWIAFLDDDDEWLPAKLQLQAENIERHPDLNWTFTNLSWRIDKNGMQPAHAVRYLPDQVMKRGFFDDYLTGYSNGFFASTITLMIRRTVFEVVGYFVPDMKRAQDNDLWFRIAYQYPRIGYVPEPLAIYHLDTPGSSTKINDSVDFMVDLAHRHIRLSGQNNRYEAFHPCLMQMLQLWIRSLIQKNRKKDAVILLKEFNEYLPGRFRREILFRLNVPFVGSAIVETVFRLKKKFSAR